MVFSQWIAFQGNVWLCSFRPAPFFLMGAKFFGLALLRLVPTEVVVCMLIITIVSCECLMWLCSCPIQPVTFGLFVSK